MWTLLKWFKCISNFVHKLTISSSSLCINNSSPHLKGTWLHLQWDPSTFSGMCYYYTITHVVCGLIIASTGQRMTNDPTAGIVRVTNEFLSPASMPDDVLSVCKLLTQMSPSATVIWRGYWRHVNTADWSSTCTHPQWCCGDNSTLIRQPFDCLSKVTKVTTT